MIDIGQFQPTAALGPTRSGSGITLGRLTTTDEQRQEAIEKMTEAAAEHKAKEVRATVLWSRGEPTILDLTFTVEHLSGVKVWLPDQLTEMTLAGAEIPQDETARLRRLTDEIADLHENGML